MLLKSVQQSKESNVRGHVQAQHPSASRKSRSNDMLSSILDIQRTRGNRYMQGVLQTTAIQRQCSCGGTCAHCRSESSRQRPDTAQRIQQRKGRGNSLDTGLRLFMETRFGEDFSRVRVHTDTQATESSAGLNAVAYTIGNDIFFGEGRYQPRSREGLRLLAHELTHVVQQRNGIIQSKGISDHSEDVFEREADRWSEKVVSDAGTSPLLQSSPSSSNAALASQILSTLRQRGYANLLAGSILSHPINLPIQRKCAECASGGGSCSTCAEEERNRHPQPDHDSLHARCPSHGPCTEDPLVRKQGGGAANCDRTTGRMVIGALTEHCAGDCVYQHEHEHQLDDAECCSRVNACLDTAAGDPAKAAACNAAYDTFFAASADHAECRAYTKEVTCLTDFIADNCDGSKRATKDAIIGGILGGILGGIGGFFLGGLIGSKAGNESLGQGIGLGVGLLGVGAIGAAIGHKVGSVSKECCDELRTELGVATTRRDTHCAAAVAVPCPFREDGTII